MNRRLWVLIPLLSAALASPTLAHGTTAGDRPVTPLAVKTQHRSAADIVALFAAERRPDAGALRTLRGARAGNPEALLPAGIDGVLRNRAPSDELIIAGFGGLDEVARCIRVVDVPVQDAGGGRVRAVVTLERASARALRFEVLGLPGAAHAAADGRTLTLEGSPAWLHQALRRVIRAELGLHSGTEERGS